MHADRFVQTVNRKWREGVHLRVAGISCRFGRASQFLRAGEFGDDAVRPFDDSADRHQMLFSTVGSSAIGWASGTSVRISKIEIIGRNRTKRNKRKRKSPIEPMNIDQSQRVA